MFFNNHIRLGALGLPKWAKISLVIFLDSLLIVLSVWLAFYLRIGEFLPMLGSSGEHFPPAAIAISGVILLPIFWKLKIYQSVFRFSDAASLQSIGFAIALFAIVYITIITLLGITGVPRTIGLIQPIVLLILVGSSRMLFRQFLSNSEHHGRFESSIKRVLIYGAGRAGREIAGLAKASDKMQALGFIDDDPSLQGRRISGLPVFAPSELSSIPQFDALDEVLLAIPTLGRQRQRQLVKNLRLGDVPVRSLPSYDAIINEQVTLSDIRELSVDEILGRDAVTAYAELLSRDITGKTVLVTGAGGSIGSELCKQILRQQPKSLVLLEQNELALFNINNELQQLSTASNQLNCKIIPSLGSINNKVHINNLLSGYDISTIYHAAAHKHVHLVEKNPLEGMRNNVLGTLNVAKAACNFGVKKFVLISTDKAVRPTSVMGASKRIAEMVLQALSVEHQSIAFAVVRFGNVLGSSGSVVPLFIEQIRQGGPITITHPNVTRYFMTISEAAQLVIQAGAMTKQVGEADVAPVYLLDMGDPVKILDLAKRMIRLSGLSEFNQKSNPNGDIEIKIIGLQPGEKLFEELLISGSVAKTTHPKIHVANEDYLQSESLKPFIFQIEDCIEKSDVKTLKQYLKGHFSDLELVQG